MILLQLSSGLGPLECCKAVALAFVQLQKESKKRGICCDVVELIPASKVGCYKSVVVKLSSPNQEVTQQFALSWQGALLWTCESQFRPMQKRKNWFFSGRVYQVNERQVDSEITFQACRASGAGGQHVNKTDSAVRAIHVKTGLSVRVESERSQHANKKLASALLLQKLAAKQEADISVQQKSRWQHHREVERGNPVKTFKGVNFAPVRK
ncbi:peptide chain release factor H [Pseudoalteromonas obscura]|uniref:Peptide chain release factor H n=1 Tax=Pseudoalteromonas obscura TaxID=3048491 RepID=A0ABT7EL61_9GAMM|nr:peptide chain release factor H [Pseudoalteromonas sp. P94(2023)]MDK2595761.1 peptide chain release factor H [Pseudoalteromonas sp. P94(2023)]